MQHKSFRFPSLRAQKRQSSHSGHKLSMITVQSNFTPDKSSVESHAHDKIPADSYKNRSLNVSCAVIIVIVFVCKKNCRTT